MTLMNKSVAVNDNGLTDKIQGELLNSLLMSCKSVTFYDLGTAACVQYADPNEDPKNRDREGLSLDFEFVGSTPNKPNGTLQAVIGNFMGLKSHIARMNNEPNLATATLVHGVVSLQLFEEMMGVCIGEWSLREAVILGARLEESTELGADNVKVPHLRIIVDLLVYLS